MTIFLYNLKRILTKPLNIICMIVVPIVFNLLFISMSMTEVKYNVGIVDLDQSKFTLQLANEITDQYDLITLEQDDIQDAVINGDVDCAIVFEKGFTEKIIRGEDVNAKIYSLNDTNSSVPLTNYFKSYMNAVIEIGKACGGDEVKFYSGMDDYYSKVYKLEYKEMSESLSKQIDTAVTSLGYIAISMMFLMTFSTMLVIQDKMYGVYDRLIVTPLKNSSYYLQHLLSYFVVSVIQIVLMLDIIPNLVDVKFGSTMKDTFHLFIVCCCFAIDCISIGVLVSRFTNKTLVAGSFISLLNIPMLMLGGCFWPREIMPETLRKIGDFMPTTWFLMGAKKVLYGNGLSSAFQYIGAMLIFSVLLMAIAFIPRQNRSTLHNRKQSKKTIENIN